MIECKLDGVTSYYYAQKIYMLIHIINIIRIIWYVSQERHQLLVSFSEVQMESSSSSSSDNIEQYHTEFAEAMQRAGEKVKKMNVVCENIIKELDEIVKKRKNPPSEFVVEGPPAKKIRKTPEDVFTLAGGIHAFEDCIPIEIVYPRNSLDSFEQDIHYYGIETSDDGESSIVLEGLAFKPSDINEQVPGGSWGGTISEECLRGLKDPRNYCHMLRHFFEMLPRLLTLGYLKHDYSILSEEDLNHHGTHCLISCYVENPIIMSSEVWKGTSMEKYLEKLPRKEVFHFHQKVSYVSLVDNKEHTFENLQKNQCYFMCPSCHIPMIYSIQSFHQ